MNISKVSESKSCSSFFTAKYLRKSALMFFHSAGSSEIKPGPQQQNNFVNGPLQLFIPY